MRMRFKPVFAGLLAGVAFVAALPVLGQEKPTSILPPGFGEPDSPPKASPKPAKPPSDDGVPDIKLNVPKASGSSSSGTKTTVVKKGDETKKPGEEEIDPDAPIPIIVDIPVQSRRSTQFVGTIGVPEGDFGAGAFQGFNGKWLGGLMASTKAPIASRWASIVLRRALLSRAASPADVNAADWVADRANLLVQMGEANAARSLVQAVDVDQYSPRLFEAGMDAAIASADPAALCGMTEYVKTDDKSAPMDEKRALRWRMAKAMCSGLSGESSIASAGLERVRDKIGDNNIDALLAEKVVGANVNTRRSVAIEWDAVKELTDWRFGLATATGLSIPPRLYPTISPRVKAWAALAPLLPAGERLAAADAAAEFGVLSSQALVDQYSARFDATDPEERDGKPFDALRRAFSEPSAGARLAAMRTLWGSGAGGLPKFSGLILTARAVATIPASADHAADAPNIVGALMCAGYDRTAARWLNAIGNNPDNGAWGLLAVGSERAMTGITEGQIDDVGATSPTHADAKARLFFAGLAGLGRLPVAEIESIAESMDVPIGRTTAWTKAINLAAKAQAPATVALLAAVGMQVPHWKDVPPEHLYHIIRAYRQVGLEAEARMIAAEALMRV